MRSILVFMLSAASMLGASDPWAKVRDLKTGTELRIYKKGAAKPVLATLDEANEENLIVVIRNEEVAIDRGDIDRLDYRGRPTPGTVTRQTQSTVTGPEGTMPRPQGNAGGSPVSTSTSTNYSFGSKGDFQTIYRRPPAKK